MHAFYTGYICAYTAYYVLSLTRHTWALHVYQCYTHIYEAMYNMFLQLLHIHVYTYRDPGTRDRGPWTAGLWVWKVDECHYYS